MYIPIPYMMNPYPHQREFLRAVIAGKNACSVVHRRGGKDVSCIQAWLLRGLKRIGTHVYLFPLQTQARAVIWKGMDYDGKPFLSSIPSCLITKKNDARMEIELINGSRLVLGGSNNFNGLMGTNPVSIIYSEFSLHNPLARQYLNPILVQNKGLEILQFTPRGKNHGFEVFDTVRENPNYFVQHLSVEQTVKWDGSPIITKEDIDEAKRRGMSDEMIRQEFYCDFDIGNVGAYFTREIADMEREGRITIFPPDPRSPLHSVWDLGGTDATAAWFFQLDGTFINCIGMLHSSGQGLKYYLDAAEKFRSSLGLQWGHHFMPHDVKQGHQGWESTESRLMQARKHGWHFQISPKVNFQDGIESLRYILPKVRLHKANTQLGLRALREYSREYDVVAQTYSSRPIDNWAVHIVDALRYLAVNYRKLYDVPMPPTKYSVSGM